MIAGFRFIQQYQDLARDIEQETNEMTSSYDQQVPQSGYTSQDCDMKYPIKLEELDPQPDLFSMMESIISNDLTHNNVPDVPSSKSLAHFHNNSIKSEQLKPSAFSTTTSQFSSFFTPSPPPSTVPPSSSCSSTSTTLNSSPTFFSRTNQFLVNVPGISCNAEQNKDFLSDTDSATPDHLASENSLEYIDLDRQQQSFYDEYQSIPDITKALDESRRLEEAAIFMRDTIYNDCDDLNVPYDPAMWTPEEVRKWVSWVCQRNGVPDVTSVLYHFDGQTLCSMNQEAFLIICGDSGIKLSNELELWKAAHSCFPSQMYYSSNSSEDNSFTSQQPNSSFLANSDVFIMSPCSSPALSSCSSYHNSTTSSTSTNSYHCDDDNSYGSEILPGSTCNQFDGVSAQSKASTKLPTGRGHKQTIHLWQFLQELLLSKDNKYSDCIRWLDRRAGVFKIEDSKKVATLWGARKNRPAMNYDKLSRSVRQYYKKGIIKKTEQSKRLVYQFCPGYM